MLVCSKGEQVSRSDVEQREIALEQAYVDTVHENLDAAAVTARSLVTEGMARGHMGHEGGLVERDAMVYQANRRLSALNAAHDGLVFGRLNLSSGEDRYIGRIGVRTADRDILLVDWRAPAAAVFYQATALDPAGVIRRRVLRLFGDQVTGVEDELLDADAASEDLVIIGEGALLASLSRARDSTMHSVVATIQKEQDDAIRAPARGATIISGGPGTGKTVVALHRAAFLLYSDRRRFEQGGVLVIGPSGVFMDYIDRVLPSLGETSVTLRSVGDVVDGLTSARHDPPAVAAIKGSTVMLDVLARLVAAPLPTSPTVFSYFYRDDVLRLEGKDLRRIRRRLLSMGRRNEVRDRVPRILLEELWRQVRGPRALERTREDFEDTVRDDDEFLDFVHAWWPPVDAVEMWVSLAGRIGELANDLIPAERAALWRAHVQDLPAIDDIPLIDELRHLLGESESGPDEDDDNPRQLMSFETEERELRPRATSSIEDDGYAHVLVDEAQDLSPMQWRMIGRRGRTASWTIVGDQAQSSWPVPEESVTARREALGSRAVHEFRLTKNYRNSAEIYEFAARAARHTITNPDLAEAVRRTGHEPEHHLVAVDAVAPATRTVVADLLARVAGTVAVVATGDTFTHTRENLADLLEAHERLRVLEPVATKGLEFDAVVLVDADQIIAEAESGWRTLYVVLTRATQFLTTVGASDHWLGEI